MTSRKVHGRDSLWRQYFTNPSQWIIRCHTKRSNRASEFMHKVSQECLWIDCSDHLTWVSEELCRRGLIISWLEKEACVPGVCDQEEAIAHVALLKECAKTKDLEKGIAIHDIVGKGLLKTNPYIQSALVNMYAKCGALEKALSVLKEQHVRNVTTWNALIAGYAQQGRTRDAFDSLEQMQMDGIAPNAVTFTSILRACSNTRDIEQGIQIHADILKMKLLENDLLLGTALVDMYAKCGYLENAQKVFDELPFRDVVTWNALIGGYAQHSQNQAALSCFEQMENDGVCPDAITFTCALKACGSIGAIDKGIWIHRKMFDKEGFSGTDTILGTALVDMYAKCGKLTMAHQVFDELLARDAAAWNALIAGYAQHGQGQNALNCFEQMNNDGISPNMTTIVCILEACGKIGAVDKGMQIHDEFIKEGMLVKDIVLGTALVDMYAKCGNLVKAQDTLDELTVRDVISWNALIAGYVHRGHGEEALNCLYRMQHEGLTPNTITFVCILNACGSTGAIDKGTQIHNEIVNKGLFERTEIVLGTALVGMYVECGDLGKAQEVFDQLLLPDVASWNTLILGYAQQGYSQKALSCFQKMQNQNLCPDIVSFLCVLNACCHSGLVEAGRMYFAEMSDKYNIEPEIEHYTCMVDLFCRAGHFHEAMAVMKKIPSSDYPVWLVLLTACEKCGNVEVGRFAFLHAVQLDSSNGAAYACMINIYIGASMYDEAKEIEAMRVKQTAVQA